METTVRSTIKKKHLKTVLMIVSPNVALRQILWLEENNSDVTTLSTFIYIVAYTVRFLKVFKISC